MKCENCGKEIPEELGICPDCYPDLRDDSKDTEDASPESTEEEPKEKSKEAKPEEETREGLEKEAAQPKEEAKPDTSGIHKIVITTIILFLVLIAGAIGVFWYLNSPRWVLALAQKRVDTIKTYHFTMKYKASVGGMATTMNAEGDVSSPDRFRMNAEMSVLTEEMNFEEIVIGNTLYMKMKMPESMEVPDQVEEWVKMTLDTDYLYQQQSGTNIKPEQYLEYLKAVKKLETKGSEEIRGIDCYHYTIEVDEKILVKVIEDKLKEVISDDKAQEKNIEEFKEMLENAELDVEFWVGKNDNLPYKQELKMEITKPTKMTIDITMDYSKFNEEVNIEAPKGAKEIKSPSSGGITGGF